MSNYNTFISDLFFNLDHTDEFDFILEGYREYDLLEQANWFLDGLKDIVDTSRFPLPTNVQLVQNFLDRV